MLYGNQAQTGGAINTVDDTILSNDGFGVLQAGQTPNMASAGGGAVNAEAGTIPSNTLTVLASDFVGNQVTGAGGTGGAIDSSVVTDVERSTFNLNQAAFGGAIDYGFSNQTTTPFTSSLIVNQDYFENNHPLSG